MKWSQHDVSVVHSSQVEVCGGKQKQIILIPPIIERIAMGRLNKKLTLKAKKAGKTPLTLAKVAAVGLRRCVCCLEATDPRSLRVDSRPEEAEQSHQKGEAEVEVGGPQDQAEPVGQGKARGKR